MACGITNAEPELELHNYITEPVLGEVNYVGCSACRNYLTDVALLMNCLSTLIGLAGFEWDGSRADATDDAPLRVLGGACHDMVLLADYGINRQ